MKKSVRILYYILSSLTLLFFILLIFFLGYSPFSRLWLSAKVFFFNIRYWLLNIIGISWPVDYQVSDYLITTSANYVSPIPINSSYLLLQIKTYFLLLVNGSNILAFFSNWQLIFVIVLQAFNVMILLYFIIKSSIKKFFRPIKNDNVFSKAYLRFDIFKYRFYYPIVNAFMSFVYFFIDHKFLFGLILIILFLFLNIGSVILDVLGGYLYFVSNLDPSIIYKVFYSSLNAMWPALKSISPGIYILLFIFIFNSWRRIRGKIILSLKSHSNQELLKNVGVISKVNGPPGSGKTTLLVMLSLYFEKDFREKLLRIMKKYNHYFPNFDWGLFRKIILEKKFLNRLALKNFISQLTDEKIVSMFIYDGPSLTYDGLKIITLSSALSTYGEAFLLYSRVDPLIISNLAITGWGRIYWDSVREHLMTFDYDVINRDFRDSSERLSHALIFNSIRIKKQLYEDRSYLGSIDGGVLAITEASKEFGNQYSNAQYKRDDILANPLTDGSVEWMSTFRHGSIIDNEPFMRVVMDYQLSGQLAAGVAGLSESTFDIQSMQSELKFSYPLFWIEPLICNFIIRITENFLFKNQMARNDKNLTVRFISWLSSSCYKYLEKMKNEYGYKTIKVQLKHGSDDSSMAELNEVNFYIIPKLIYSNRFRTDSLSEMFNVLYKEAIKGFEDLPVFNSIVATREDLLIMRGYFTETVLNADYKELIEKNLRRYYSEKEKEI